MKNFKHTIVLMFAFMALTLTTNAQRTVGNGKTTAPPAPRSATTEDGKRVLLYENGSWVFDSNQRVSMNQSVEENNKTFELNGVQVRVLSCRIISNKLVFNLELNNSTQDNIDFSIYPKDTVYRDNLGNEFDRPDVAIANKRDTITLVPNVRTKAILYYGEFDKQSTMIKTLTVSTYKQQLYEFKDIRIEK